MTRLFLIRHARTAQNGHRLTGRSPGIGLDERGRAEAVALAARLPALAAVYSGPLQRAQETAAALGYPVETVAALDEIDFGAWTGQPFDALADPAWSLWNRHRGLGRPPGGESALAVQARAVAFLDAARKRCEGAAFAAVSHGDVIRAAIAFWLGVPLDLMHRFAVDTGCATEIRWVCDEPVLHALNA